MVHRFYKHKLLLDENMPFRTEFPRLNGLFDVKHIYDLKKGGISDKQVYALASKLKRLIITFNTKDFKPLIKKNATIGVIGISTNLSSRQIDIKLTALLVHSSEKILLGKLTIITGET